MKNLKVKIKLSMILGLVTLLVILGSLVSVKNMISVKDKALESMDEATRTSYDQSIKEQVDGVISLLDTINKQYEAGNYTLEEAKKLAADEVREMRYGETGYFWIDQSDGTNVVLLERLVATLKRLSSKAKPGFLPGIYRIA